MGLRLLSDLWLGVKNQLIFRFIERITGILCNIKLRGMLHVSLFLLFPLRSTHVHVISFSVFHNNNNHTEGSDM